MVAFNGMGCHLCSLDFLGYYMMYYAAYAYMTGRSQACTAAADVMCCNDHDAMAMEGKK